MINIKNNQTLSIGMLSVNGLSRLKIHLNTIKILLKTTMKIVTGFHMGIENMDWLGGLEGWYFERGGLSQYMGGATQNCRLFSCAKLFMGCGSTLYRLFSCENMSVCSGPTLHKEFCLQRIWTTLTKQYSYAVSSQHG